MKVQSLSIVVPNKECMNKCPFCVARMVNSNIYENKMSINDFSDGSTVGLKIGLGFYF